MIGEEIMVRRGDSLIINLRKSDPNVYCRLVYSLDGTVQEVEHIADGHSLTISGASDHGFMRLEGRDDHKGTCYTNPIFLVQKG